MVRLRFIGKPGGTLMKGAPGNLVQGQVYTGPVSWAKDFKFWELVDPAPEVTVPEMGAEDSVYEDVEFVPSDEIPEGLRSTIPGYEDRVLTLPGEEATSFTGQGFETTTVTVVTEEDLEKKTRPQLMAFIDSRDGKYQKSMKKAVLLEIAKNLL